MKKRILIIGGGIHGFSSAIALSDLDYEIMLIEKKSDFFLGTSGSTHNRAHMGYHYPRAADTVRECLDGLEMFKSQFKDVFIYPNGNYYTISKSNTETTDRQFECFCNQFNLPYEMKWPDKCFLVRDVISKSFLVPELIFDAKMLKSIFINRAIEKNIILKRNTELLKGQKISDDQFKVKVNENGATTEYVTNLLVNATYAYSNNILKSFGLEHHMKKYKLQILEVPVVRSKHKIPGLTVMDGPFISVMPYGKTSDLFLIYDVENSVNKQKEGYVIDDSMKIKSNWEKMKNKGRQYFPFMDSLEYVDSLKAYRPIPLHDVNRDRSTKIKQYDDFPGFYSILEGKFISALLIAEKLKKIISLER